MNTSQFLLYGAYGYTGGLIAGLAGSFGLQPVLAGRDEKRLKVISDKTGFQFEVIMLQNVLDMAICSNIDLSFMAKIQHHFNYLL